MCFFMLKDGENIIIATARGLRQRLTRNPDVPIQIVDEGLIVNTRERGDLFATRMHISNEPISPKNKRIVLFLEG